MEIQSTPHLESLLKARLDQIQYAMLMRVQELEEQNLSASFDLNWHTLRARSFTIQEALEDIEKNPKLAGFAAFILEEFGNG